MQPGTTILALAAGLAAAACVGTAALEAPAGEPLVIGPIESIAHHATASGLLVRAGPRSQERCGIAATVDGDTQYLRRAGDGLPVAAALAELEVGDTVEVYVEGPVAESCPVQARASLVLLRTP